MTTSARSCLTSSSSSTPVAHDFLPDGVAGAHGLDQLQRLLGVVLTRTNIPGRIAEANHYGGTTIPLIYKEFSGHPGIHRRSREHLVDRTPVNPENPCRLSAAHTLDNNCVSYAPVKFHPFHPRPLQKQKAYHWRVFTPANNQTIWPLQWWIIAPAFSPLTGREYNTQLKPNSNLNIGVVIGSWSEDMK